MKKILLVFDGTEFSEGAFAFAEWLNQKEKILLTAVFLPQVELANLWSMSGGGTSGSLFIPLVEKADADIVAKNIARFTDLCHTSGISYKIHKDFNGFAIQELITESRFTDLLILGIEKFYKSSGQATEFLEDALHGVECPVIIVPEKFDMPDNVILAYDGEAASVYAAKQFAYLFPYLCLLPAVIIYADTEEDNTLPSETNMQEWASVHFKDLDMKKLMDTGRHFNEWFDTKKNALLITGSFGRSQLSRMFRRSFTSTVIKSGKAPVFIAHH